MALVDLNSLQGRSRRNSLPLASSLIFLFIGSVAAAQVVFETQGELEIESCSEAAVNAETSNGFHLFLGAMACYEEGQVEDGTFLLLAGQQRSVADMSVFEPSGDDAMMAAAELYGFIFYQAGGLGPTELYREEGFSNELVERLGEWEPELTDDYDPGWRYRANPRVEIYQTVVSEEKERRIATIERQARLLSNDEYYAATVEFEEIQARNGALEVGTEDYDRARELMARMAEISAELPPLPVFKSSIEFEYRPDPDAPFRQVFMGVNGPATNGSSVFTSLEEVNESWLSRALSDAELASVLAEVDFTEQVLVSYNLGEAQTATGRTYITDLRIDSAMRVARISAAIGVMESGCEFELSTSYPFALAVIDRDSAVSDGSTSSGRSNFGDGCQRLQPTTQND